MPPYFIRSILADIEMDEKRLEVYEKFNEKETSATEMDLTIQADRVIYVINRCMAKLSVMAHLPFLLDNDAELMEKYLKPKEFNFVLRVLTKWGAEFDRNISKSSISREYMTQPMLNNPSYYSSIFDKSQSHASTTTRSTTIDALSDPQTFQMIDILFYNKCFQTIIRKAEKAKVDKNLMEVIRVFQDLKAVAKSKLYVTGDEEDAMNKELRRTYKSNDLLTVAIDDLKEQLEKQRKELGDQLNEKVKIFEMYHKKMETIKENFQTQIKRILHVSEKRMMHRSIESETKQTELAEEAKKLVIQYETLLADHLEQEKISRSKRFKTETQLQNWLTKYDQDIGERQAQYETLKKEYDEKKAEIEQLEELIDEQEEEYTTLMEEKRLEEERIYNEMAYQFLLNRSARKIQRYWRAYRERRAKRRGKKGKGKRDKSKGKYVPRKITVTRTSDPNLALGKDKKIQGHVFENLKNPESEVFQKREVSVVL